MKPPLAATIPPQAGKCRSSQSTVGDRLRVVVGLVLKAAGFRQRQTGRPACAGEKGERDPGVMADDGGLGPPLWGRHSERGF